MGRRLGNPFLTLHGLWGAWDAILASVHKAALALGDRAAQAWALHQLGVLQIGSGNLAGAQVSPKSARFAATWESLQIF